MLPGAKVDLQLPDYFGLQLSRKEKFRDEIDRNGWRGPHSYNKDVFLEKPLQIFFKRIGYKYTAAEINKISHNK